MTPSTASPCRSAWPRARAWPAWLAPSASAALTLSLSRHHAARAVGLRRAGGREGADGGGKQVRLPSHARSLAQSVQSPCLLRTECGGACVLDYSSRHRATSCTLLRTKYTSPSSSMLSKSPSVAAPERGAVNEKLRESVSPDLSLISGVGSSAFLRVETVRE